MSLLTHAQLTVDGAAARHMPLQPGLYDIETRLDDGRRARFSLSLPPPPAPGGTLALVLVLHYAGQPTRFYGRPLLEHLFEPALRPLGAVFVAPESLGGQWSEPANEAYVMQLLAAVETAYPIDRVRVAVGGYSMGALGTWHLIEHYPRHFAAAIPIAGLPADEVTAPVPVFMLATPSDEIFAIARFEALVADLEARRRPVTFRRVKAHGHYDVTGFRDALGHAVPWLQRAWGERF